MITKIIHIGRKRYPADKLPDKFKHLILKPAPEVKPTEKKKSGN